MTVTTMRARLARLLEPRAPRPDLRLDALRTLREAGLEAGVFVMPVLPGITDREEDLDALARAARDAGALWLASNVLFLMPSARAEFFPFLEKQFPRLARQYREWYERAGHAPESYSREMGQRIGALRQKYGLRAWPESRRLEQAPVQLTLGLAVARSPRTGAEPDRRQGMMMREASGAAAAANSAGTAGRGIPERCAPGGGRWCGCGRRGREKRASKRFPCL